MPQEQPQIQPEKSMPPLNRMKEIFATQGLHTFEKFHKLEHDMIDTKSPKLADLFTIANWAEERKTKNPNWADNLDKAETKALTALLKIMEKSPDAKKWSQEIQTISKSEGKNMVNLIEKRIILLGAQRRQAEDYKQKDIDKEIAKLNDLHTRLELFVHLLH